MFKIPGPVLYAWFWSPQRLLQELENNYEILCCTHNTEGFGYYCMNWKTTARKTLCCTHNSEGFSDCDMKWRTSARNCIWVILMVSATIACTGKQLWDPVLYPYFWKFQQLWHELENNCQILYCTCDSDGFVDNGRNWRTTTRCCIVPLLQNVSMTVIGTGEQPPDPLLYPYLWCFSDHGTK